MGCNHGCRTRSCVQKRPELGLMLYCHLLEILNGFAFELVFCEWCLTGQCSLHEDGGADAVQYECACPLSPAVRLQVVFKMPHECKALVGVHQVVKQVQGNALCL